MVHLEHNSLIIWNSNLTGRPAFYLATLHWVCLRDWGRSLKNNYLYTLPRQTRGSTDMETAVGPSPDLKGWTRKQTRPTWRQLPPSLPLSLNHTHTLSADSHLSFLPTPGLVSKPLSCLQSHLRSPVSQTSSKGCTLPLLPLFLLNGNPPMHCSGLCFSHQ